MTDEATAARTRIALCVGLALLVAAVYAPVRHHDYLDYDDMAFLVWNPDLEPASPGEALRNAFTRTLASNLVPLTSLSHQLDRALYGRDASGALITNAVLHGIASILLLLALARLTGRLGASAFAAAVFAVHPLHVESVAWASERKDVLSAVFFAALLGLHARHAAAPGRYLAPTACLALGLLSKPMLVTAPFVLLLLDHWPLRRLGVEAVREKLPMFALVGLSALATLHVQRRTGAMSFGASVPLWGRIENALDASVAYLVDAFWPTGLAAYYPHPGLSLTLAHDLAMVAILAALSLAAFALRRSRPWLLVGWLWYLIMLVPVLGLVQVGIQARADRYTYLPLIGIALALGVGVDAWARTAARRRVAAACGAVSIAALVAVALPQVHYWRDSRTLYERMRSVHPEASFPVLRLGMVNAIDGDFAAARPLLERAHAMDPASAEQVVHQLSNLARFHDEQGRAERARLTLAFAIDFARDTGQLVRARELARRLRARQESRR